MRPILLVTLFSLAAGAAIAQAPVKPSFALPTESVTIIATKPTEETIRSFVETRTTPTRIVGKMARWQQGVCPLTIGLGDKYAKYVTERVRAVAAAVGAPVATAPCKVNVEIVFTTTPQAFMDTTRKSAPVFLGYHDSASQADEMAKVTHPIQSWYTTESVDYDGASQVDRGMCNSTETINTLPIQLTSDLQNPQAFAQLVLPCATIMHSSGSRLHNGYESGFYNVLIVAEPAKLFDFEMGALADYIAMLALSQPSSLDACQEMPSISNMLAKGCASAPAKITDGDLAYLQGLYNMPRGYSLAAQQNEMRFEMKKTLVTDKQ
jgi:hypothetical protein